MPDTLDLLKRLSTAARIYLHATNPRNNVPRSVVQTDRDALLVMLAETDVAVFNTKGATTARQIEKESES